jgi:catechol 2,3-dioxygenase-like lactoylglutathione lyase family enzyme
VRLNQVPVAVSDLDRSVAFYGRLGLEQIVAGDGYARFACPDGDSTFSIHQAPTVSASATTVYFECEDLAAMVSALQGDGVVFARGPVDQPWLWREARTVARAGTTIQHRNSERGGDGPPGGADHARCIVIGPDLHAVSRAADSANLRTVPAEHVDPTYADPLPDAPTIATMAKRSRRCVEPRDRIPSNAIVPRDVPGRSLLGDSASPRAKPASRGGLLLPALVLTAEQGRS